MPPEVKARYFEADISSTVVTKAIDGAPQRVIRTKMIDRLENARFSAFPRALRNALRFRNLTDTSMRDLLKDGLAMRRNQKLPWRQVVMAANAPLLTKAALVDGYPEVGILPTGMGLGVIDSPKTCEEIVSEMVTHAAARLSDAADVARLSDAAELSVATDAAGV